MRGSDLSGLEFSPGSPSDGRARNGGSIIARRSAICFCPASASQELGERDFHSLSEQDRQLVALAIVRRETGVMTVSVLVVAFLVWRAAITTAGIF